ncbi:MAG: site-specific integrase [Bdellovibrionaceae bacterium]|nr:site-specific integrase [Pseudobdellovibrionaceae bacterium]
MGIREIQFHDLRATHITNLLENGASISKVMKQVGHSKMSTTDGYHRLTGVKVKGLTNHLSFIPPKDELPENVVALFPKKVSN